MARLGKEEQNYCRQHGIPQDRLFDAEGLKRAAYNRLSSQDEKGVMASVFDLQMDPAGNGLQLHRIDVGTVL